MFRHVSYTHKEIFNHDKCTICFGVGKFNLTYGIKLTKLQHTLHRRDTNVRLFFRHNKSWEAPMVLLLKFVEKEVCVSLINTNTHIHKYMRKCIHSEWMDRRIGSHLKNVINLKLINVCKQFFYVFGIAQTHKYQYTWNRAGGN